MNTEDVQADPASRDLHDIKTCRLRKSLQVFYYIHYIHTAHF